MTVVGIDASRCRSGGAIAHISGLLDAAKPNNFGITKVHIWCNCELMLTLKNKPWLIKHYVGASKYNIVIQILWQLFFLRKVAIRNGVTVMFNADSSSFCSFLPSVTLNQDLLSFEPSEMQRYSWLSYYRYHLLAQRYVQKIQLRYCSHALFLSNYAKNQITKYTKPKNSTVVPHGVNPIFFTERRLFPKLKCKTNINCLYISNALPYKHQWSVVEGVSKLRKETGLSIILSLVGGGCGPAYNKLKSSVLVHDPSNKFVKMMNFVSTEEVLDQLKSADIFIFASSCEAFGITLLEAMAASLPIACSNKSSLPDLVQDGAILFDPECPNSIAQTLLAIIDNDDLRHKLSNRASDIAKNYTWENCANKTMEILTNVK